MDWQLSAVWLLLAGAVLYVACSLWRSVRASGCGGGGCGKCAAPANDKASGRIPLQQVKQP